MGVSEGLPPPEGADPALQNLYRLWASHVRDGRLPSVREIGFDEFLDKHPGTALITVERRQDLPTRYRYARVGRGHRAALGRDIEGYAIDELVAPQQIAYYVSVYDRIVENAAPHYWMRMNSLVGSDLNTFERLLVPVSEDGENVDGLVGVWVWFDEHDDSL